VSATLVWVLVIVTHIGGHSAGEAVTISGDYATAQDCERVKQSVLRSSFAYPAYLQCVQTRKVKP
jgi:hypothetical protein